MSGPRVVIFSTGGTVAMKPAADGSGVQPALSGRDLVEAVPGLGALCEPEVREFSNIPSCQMTPALMLELAGRVRDALDEPDVRGVVVTHGTDTVEETAYFLDCVLDSEKPVVFTAAMRAASDVSADGPANILCAVKTALAPEARGLGVLVTLNEQIHAAREVTKTHAANPATFASPWWGPLGYVDDDMVLVARRPARRHPMPARALGGEVWLLKMYAGCDDTLINVLIDRKVAGIVVEGMGRGNVPPVVQEAMIRAVKAGIPVVLATRCPAGRPYYAYGYAGGGRISRENGIIFAGELNGQKARLRLMLALGLTSDPDELQGWFDQACPR